MKNYKLIRYDDVGARYLDVVIVGEFDTLEEAKKEKNEWIKEGYPKEDLEILNEYNNVVYEK